MKTGNTRQCGADPARNGDASMEPGHEDREYWPPRREDRTMTVVPQWSPVMKTGNTRAASAAPSQRSRLNGARS